MSSFYFRAGTSFNTDLVKTCVLDGSGITYYYEIIQIQAEAIKKNFTYYKIGERNVKNKKLDT